MLKLPFVSRDRYDELSRRYDTLEQRYHEMRLQGGVERKPPRVVPPPPSPEAMAAKRMHDDLAREITTYIQTERPDLPAGVAEREAERIRSAAVGRDGLPT